MRNCDGVAATTSILQSGQSLARLSCAATLVLCLAAGRLARAESLDGGAEGNVAGTGSTPRAALPLSADQVAAKAALVDPTWQSKQQAVAAAEARLDSALIQYIPKLTLGARYTRLSKITPPSLVPASAAAALPPDVVRSLRFPVYLNQYSLQASLDVPLSDYVFRLSHDAAAQRDAHVAAELDALAARRKAALDARVAYYTWVRARGEAEVARKSREALQAHLEQARASLEGRVVSTADVLDVESRLSLAELVLRRAEDLVALSEAQLRIILRDTSGAPYAPADSREPADPNRPFAALREQALQSRAELRALTTTNKSLRSQARARAAAEFPRLDAIGNVYYQNPNPRYIPQQDRFDATWDVGVQLTWSPTDALSAAATRREAEAQARQIDDQRRALVDAIELEVLSAYQAREQARVAQETARRGLSSAEEAFRVRNELFRLGRATSTELSDSQTELTRARLSVVNAEVDLRVARARLSHAVGED